MKKREKPTNKNSAAVNPTLSLEPSVHPDCAGIDVGAEELVAAVASGRCAGHTVRAFSSFTSGVHALRDWLVDCGIKTVAIESTGNYWITTYAVLEDAGIEVYLVNARHVKNVPGRKSDVQDAQWLQQLHAAGFLQKSFRPAKDIVPLRYVMRHRAEMVAEGARQLQLMQKVLTEMNLHIAHVFSDIDGDSAQRIISAILAGERDVHQLAQLRDQRCRSPLAKIIEALKGDYRPEYLFVLRQCQQRWEQIRRSLAECDQEIGRLCATIAGEAGSGPLPPSGDKGRPAPKKNSLAMPVFEESWRFYGIDLSTVPGVGSGLLATLMSELGTGSQIKGSFRSAQAFASWLGLCPDNRISGGKVLKAKTRKVVSRVASALRMAALSLRNSQSKLGEYCRRMKGRLGKAEGITATAHKLSRILYAMITRRVAYNEEEAFKVTPATQARRIKNLHKQATQLGLKLVAAT